MARYVAMGSSFASGPGVEPVIAPACGRSANNYAHLVADRLDYALVDVTCGGATTANIVQTPQELMTGATVPVQIDAVTADADLVTVTIGGNDVDHMLNLYRFSYRAQPEAVPPIAAPFFDTAVDAGLTEAALAELPARMSAVLGEIRRRAPQARIVQVDYLTVVPPHREGCDRLPVHGDGLEFCRDVQRRLEEATAEAATDAGVELLRASQLSREHSVCSAEPWVSGWEFGQSFGGLAAYHPNAAGMRAVADALVELLG